MLSDTVRAYHISEKMYLYYDETRDIRQNIAWAQGKLDGVGPVDNRPSTNYLHQFVRIFFLIWIFFFFWQVTFDMWDLKDDMRYLTHDMWHLTQDTLQVVNIVSIFPLPSSIGLGVLNILRKRIGVWLNFFFRQIFFIFMLTKEYIFVFKNFLLLHKLKKWRRPHLCQLFSYATHINTCWAKPNDPRLLYWQITIGESRFYH